MAMFFRYIKNFLLASDKPSATDDQQPIIYIPYDDEYNSWTKLNRRCQRKCRKIVKSQAMFWVNNRFLIWLIGSVQSMNAAFQVIIVLVFLNSCVLATEHYNQPDWLSRFQEGANLTFVALFTVELFFKLYALGFHVSFVYDIL